MASTRCGPAARFPPVLPTAGGGQPCVTLGAVASEGLRAEAPELKKTAKRLAGSYLPHI